MKSARIKLHYLMQSVSQICCGVKATSYVPTDANTYELQSCMTYCLTFIQPWVLMIRGIGGWELLFAAMPMPDKCCR